MNTIIGGTKSKWKCIANFLIAAIMLLNLTAFDVPKKATALENVIYVSESGNDFSGNGTSDNPYRSIGKAASQAVAGTTVLVRAGTYIEENITPKESGRQDAMIIFRPEKQSDVGKVIIKHNDKFDVDCQPKIVQKLFSQRESLKLNRS